MKNRKIYMKYSNKRVNAKKENIPFYLSFKEFCELLDRANIEESDIGVTGFHLARFNDTGPYSIDNCRFIPYKDNIKEKIISTKSKIACRNNMLNIIHNRSAEEKSRIATIAAKASVKSPHSIAGKNKLTIEEIEKRVCKIKNSGINLHKYGWVSKVAALLGISHTQVRRFMKTYYN